MFRGNTTVNLDEKGRFAIPARYREQLQDGCEGKLVVTLAVDSRCVGVQDCLWVYPMPEWIKLEEKVLAKSSTNKVAAKFRRFMVGSALESEMDSQGRILLPEKYRKFARLDKKIVLVGQLTRFELWNEEAWLAQEAQFFEDNDDDALKEMGDISF